MATRERIISKINNNSIRTTEELKVENDKYKVLIQSFIAGESRFHTYGLLPEGISDVGGLIQAFYYDNKNLEKFKAAFPGVYGVSNITPTSANNVAYDGGALPAGFKLPSTITDLGFFGESLTSLPQNFSLPSSITNLGHFGRNLTSLPRTFSLPSSITGLGEFGTSLTSFPQNFTLPSSVTYLGSFGQSLPKTLTLPTLDINQGNFGFSLTSLSINQHLLLLDGTEITKRPIEYIKNVNNVGKWYSGTNKSGIYERTPRSMKRRSFSTTWWRGDNTKSKRCIIN